MIVGGRGERGAVKGVSEGFLEIEKDWDGMRSVRVESLSDGGGRHRVGGVAEICTA